MSTENKPMENLKGVAMELASLIACNSEDSERINLLWRQIRQNSLIEDKPYTSAPQPEKSTIGIWEEKEKDGEQIFLRKEDYKWAWREWADINSFRKQKKCKRVVLLGESVARGFFYDPIYTPSLVLQDLLDKCCESDEFEVLDLARVGFNLDELHGICEPVVTDLEPDLVVIFAGNNWVHSLFGSLRKADAAEISSLLMHSTNWEEFKKTLERKLDGLIERLVENIAGLSEKTNTQFLFIIPDFNITGWSSTDFERISPWAEDLTAEWIEEKNKAEDAIAKRELLQAEASISRLRAIDGSRHPYSFELLAYCAFLRGDFIQERKYLEQANDTIIYGRIWSRPRMLSTSRKVLIDSLSSHNISYIDLFEVFHSHHDRTQHKSLFLDYCHLSSEGIRIAMAKAAQQILKLQKNVSAKFDQLLAESLAPDAETEGLARVLAALHSSQCGQLNQVAVRLDEAVTLSGLAVDFMAKYIDFSSKKNANVLCSSYEEMIKGKSYMQYEKCIGVYQGSGARKLLEIKLVDTMAESLGRLEVSSKDYVDELRVRHHGIGKIALNLLTPCYSCFTFEEIPNIQRVFHQFRDFQSKFIFFSQTAISVKIKICVRLPDGIYPSSKICVRVNNQIVSEIIADHIWKNMWISVDKKLVREGVNNLTIEWPIPQKIRPTNNNKHVLSPSMILLNRMYPVYGELQQLTIEVVENENGVSRV